MVRCLPRVLITVLARPGVTTSSRFETPSRKPLALGQLRCKIRGLVLGDFPDCEPPVSGSPSVHDVCARILAPLGIPIVYGAPIGHTARSILTIPLGVRARLSAEDSGTLEILEPAVIE